MDRLTRIVVTDGTNLISDIAWSYDADQNVTAITTRVNNNGALRTDTYAYSYDDDHRPTNTTYGSVSESIAYDGYSRVTGKTVQNSGNTVLSTSYAYRDIDAQYTTTQVSSLTNTFGGNTLSHSYTYDANGNILSDGSTTYAYDSLNQLVWEYNTAAGKAWNYAYDLGGNILSKTEYDYADGQTSNPVTVSYTYGDAAWRDLLTAYNGEAITYDGIGNPTSYRGWGMTWQGGRQLASMQKDGTTISFSYNDAGLRTEKTVNGSTRRYIWNSAQLMADVGAADAFYFHYSSGGELIGYTYKTADAETECILVKNQQGDVERVISADGTILAAYTYDAWGNVLTSEGSLAAANPIRYRGYYFDAETGLYYLQSRYYDPEIGRWINADNQLSTGSDLTGLNLFAYCGNDPINRIDPIGEAWWHWALGAAVVAACAVATVVTCGGFAAAATAVCMVGNGVVAATTASTVAAAAFIGSATVYGTAVLAAASSSNSIEEFNAQGNWGTVAATAGGAVFNGVAAYVATRTPTTTVYRSVSSAEAQNIKNTGQFNLAPGGMESKQFGFNLSETRQFGNTMGQNTIVSAKVPNSMLNQLYTGGVDTSIFRAGTLTVYGDQLGAFNQAVSGTIKFMS